MMNDVIDFFLLLYIRPPNFVDVLSKVVKYFFMQNNRLLVHLWSHILECIPRALFKFSFGLLLYVPIYTASFFPFIQFYLSYCKLSLWSFSFLCTYVCSGVQNAHYCYLLRSVETTFNRQFNNHSTKKTKIRYA